MSCVCNSMGECVCYGCAWISLGIRPSYCNTFVQRVLTLSGGFLLHPPFGHGKREGSFIQGASASLIGANLFYDPHTGVFLTFGSRIRFPNKTHKEERETGYFCTPDRFSADGARTRAAMVIRRRVLVVRAHKGETKRVGT